MHPRCKCFLPREKREVPRYPRFAWALPEGPFVIVRGKPFG